VIEGLAPALEEAGEPGVPELERALAETFRGPAALVELHTFKRGVHRLAVDCGGPVRTVVIKRLRFERARRNELASRRWLPAVGLEHACPALLGCAAERRGLFLWQVYEDVGDGALETAAPDPARVAAVAQLVATIHASFAEHPMLAEARLAGGDLGLPFFVANVTDARYALRAVRSRAAATLDLDRRALLDRLLARLEELGGSVPRRAEAFSAHSGPETLLHGDLWTTNTFAVEGRRRACLIDWDHAGAGPASYDVSTFLLRFPREHRAWVLQLYRDALEQHGGRMASARDANVLFETAELARYANQLCWLGLALLDEDEGWAWEACRDVERWFEALEPVVPEPEPLVGAGGRA
jgi:phosphotransferase family enzyme